ncbi:hypothetical protein IC575_005668 [Cucumis melo]
MLKNKRQAIGWTLDDIKGISPTFCIHHIILEEEAKEKIQPQRRLNPTLKEVVMKEVLKLKDVEIIYPVPDSTWVSPIHVVSKKTEMIAVKNDKGEMVSMRMQNGWRMCIDYRKLNQVTKMEHFPLPFLDQMIERLAGKSYFYFLDGFSVFYQTPIACEDQKKTTFTCDYGTYAFRCMPFGLCNAPGTFQRCMMSIFSDFIEESIEVLMDDFTVYGDSFDACLASLELILNRCIGINLILNYEKCHFMLSHGIVLGHLVSSKGIDVDKAKIDVIQKLPYPTCIKYVGSFLGSAGFYRQFIKDFSKIILPVTNLLQKDVRFLIDDNFKKGFDDLKKWLVSTPILQSPNWNLPFKIMYDSSNLALGAVLGQRIDKKLHVIYYASRTLN